MEIGICPRTLFDNSLAGLFFTPKFGFSGQEGCGLIH